MAHELVEELRVLLAILEVLALKVGTHVLRHRVIPLLQPGELQQHPVQGYLLHGAAGQVLLHFFVLYFFTHRYLSASALMVMCMMLSVMMRSHRETYPGVGFQSGLILVIWSRMADRLGSKSS